MIEIIHHFRAHPHEGLQGISNAVLLGNSLQAQPHLRHGPLVYCNDAVPCACIAVSHHRHSLLRVINDKGWCCICAMWLQCGCKQHMRNYISTLKLIVLGTGWACMRTTERGI